MEEVKNAAAEAAQEENVEQQAPQVENKEQAKTPAEEKKEPEIVIPEWKEQKYESSSILLSKSIDEVDEDLKANPDIKADSFKQLVECWPGARFTPTAKTKGVVTAGAESMQQLTEALQKMYKRSILIKAL
jgi:hypothetical protein